MPRPCKYKGGPRSEWVDGIFHRWGDAWAYGNGDDRLPFTIAIVEDYEEGKVHSVNPEDVLFTAMPDEFDTSDDAVQLRDRLAQCRQ